MRHENYEKQLGCPIEAALEVIGGKWKGVILFHLSQGMRRYNELHRLMPAVTQRVLTLQLRELVDAGVVTRTAHAEIPPRVEYQLSEFGITLLPLLSQLQTWGKRLLENRQGKNN